MTQTPTRPAARATALPATIWLAPSTSGPSGSSEPENPKTVVPGWALRRIRTEFTHRPGDTPAPLLHIDIPDTDHGMDARTRHLPTSDTPIKDSPPPVLLAQLRPDTVLAAGPDQPAAGSADGGLPGFFYRAHRLLRRGGLLLIACRQQHRADGELLDPSGQLVASARSAGFVYRQHILLVHATASGNRLHPTPDAPDTGSAPFWRHRPIHTDLLLFTSA